MREFCRELNLLYLQKPQLWQNDQDWEGFQWVQADDRENNSYVYRRMDRRGAELLIAINFSPVLREHYCISLPEKACYHCILNSESIQFGGGGTEVAEILPRKREDGSYYGEITLPPLGAVIWERKDSRPGSRQSHHKK